MLHLYKQDFSGHAHLVISQKDAGSNTVVKPIFVEIQFCGFYLESIHEIKVLIKAESYDNRWYFWDHCQQIFISSKTVD